jgi:hypothetical protein
VSDLKIQSELESLLVSLRNSPAQTKAQSLGSSLSLDHVIVFNRSHLDVFQSNPLYRDIFTYINSFAPEAIEIQELARAMDVTVDAIRPLLAKLKDIGVVMESGNKYRAAKQSFYFPDDQDFFALRNDNFRRNADAILNRMRYEDIRERQAFRGLITRELTQDQAVQITEELDRVIAKMTLLPETQNPDRVFSLCLLMGERYRRALPGSIAGIGTGLRTQMDQQMGQEIGLTQGKNPLLR